MKHKVYAQMTDPTIEPLFFLFYIILLSFMGWAILQNSNTIRQLGPQVMPNGNTH